MQCAPKYFLHSTSELPFSIPHFLSGTATLAVLTEWDNDCQRALISVIAGCSSFFFCAWKFLPATTAGRTLARRLVCNWHQRRDAANVRAQGGFVWVCRRNGRIAFHEGGWLHIDAPPASRLNFCAPQECRRPLSPNGKLIAFSNVCEIYDVRCIIAPEFGHTPFPQPKTKKHWIFCIKVQAFETKPQA